MSRGLSSPTDELEKGRKLYIGGLLETVKKEEITREFEKFGDLKDVWVARNPPGFAFVEFTKAVDAEKAVRTLDGMNVCGSRIRCEFANSTGSKGRGRTFGRGQGRPMSPGSPRSGPRGRPRTPPMPPTHRGRPLSPRSRSPFSRRRSPPMRYPYDFPFPYPDPNMPYPFPGYPMMPFLPPEELMRFFRSRSPYGSGRRSPRRRSRSPFGSRSGRDDFYRDRSSPPPRAGGPPRYPMPRGRSRERFPPANRGGRRNYAPDLD